MHYKKHHGATRPIRLNITRINLRKILGSTRSQNKGQGGHQFYARGSPATGVRDVYLRNFEIFGC